MEIEEKAFYEAMKQNIHLTERLKHAINLLWMQVIAVSIVGIMVVVLLIMVMYA